ncbi:MAG: PilT/PilU family type 4a pilus ATPase [Deltaproteobacteria bacterium]|nr:PilT/PilU family type 4a pilus ATPase [Deltaproteobacteria bacterium]
MARLDSFLRLVAEQGVSDLHFHSGNVPIVRHEGELMPLPFRTLSEGETRRFLFEIITDRQRDEFEKTHELDFVYVLDGVGRFRANFMMQSQGVGAVFRVIPGTVPSLDSLGMSAAVKKLAHLTNGLVLITGPTGSGKTTTLAAMVHEINTNEPRHVISIEDPIEFIHPSLVGSVTQRQVGEHAATFASALRSALRESPDVLVVGELRDLETIQLALQAAETGVLVFGTLHSNSASKAIDRIVDAVPDEARDQVRGTLSVLLRGVLSQHLLRRENGEGRVAATELLLQSYAVSHLIREGKTFQIDAYLDSASNDGSGAEALDHCLGRFLREGQITLEEALKVANAPDALKKFAAELSDDR